MPLNPNGKIDKPALPFPDTTQVATTVPSADVNTTEDTMRKIWESILPSAPQLIPTDESFFDLGGHSILATRLIFEIRKVFVVNAPLGLVFDQPTIAGLVGAVDALRNADLGLDSSRLSALSSLDDKKAAALPDYGQDYLNLIPKLQETYSPLPPDFSHHPLTVFLTGATGFLGAFVLRDLLSRESRVQKVICLVRASTSEKALGRLKEGSSDRGVWDDSWVASGRLEVVTGDLSLDLFGLGQSGWDRIANEADVVVHNGALVNMHVFLSSSFHNRYPTGALGLSLRKTPRRQRDIDPDCDKPGLHWQAKGICVRVVYIRH